MSCSSQKKSDKFLRGKSILQKFYLNCILIVNYNTPQN